MPERNTFLNVTVSIIIDAARLIVLLAFVAAVLVWVGVLTGAI